MVAGPKLTYCSDLAGDGGGAGRGIGGGDGGGEGTDGMGL